MARLEIARAWLLVLALSGFASSAAAQSDGGMPLYLAVTVNHEATELIAALVKGSDGRLGATRGELEDIGLAVAPELAPEPEQVVWLSDIPGLTYTYDEPTQSIDIAVDVARLAPQDFLLRPAGEAPSASGEWGAVVNYDLRGGIDLSGQTQPSVAALLLGRAFSPFGLLEQSSSVDRSGAFTRLDTSYRLVDPASLHSLTAGDYVADGLSWTRPVRLGGLELRKTFEMRPDLVTSPQLALGGTALVPSTVDVLLNSSNAFSTSVSPGPFTIGNIPAQPGDGDVTLVVTDADGNRTTKTVPFRAVPGLLRPGLSQWSVGVGWPRLDYGSDTDAYGPDAVGLASLRLGLTDMITGEVHAEAGAGIVNGGIGTVVSLGEFGGATGAVAASAGADGVGGQVHLSWQNSLYGVNVGISAEGTFGAYSDLASATARDPLVGGVPRDRLSLNLSAPLWFDSGAGLGLNLVLQHDADGTANDLLTAGYSQSFAGGGGLWLSGYHQMDKGQMGVVVGLSMPISADTVASTAVTAGPQGLEFSSEVGKPLTSETASVGWHLRDVEGATPFREAGLSYRGGLGTVAIGATQSGGSFGANLELRGAIAAVPGSVFLSNWIDDSFAVVETGAAGVTVLSENHPVGTTGADGRLLVPGLQSYTTNRLSIDPDDLPPDAEVGQLEAEVTPSYRSGATVKFDIRRREQAALVVFVGSDGKVLPAGAMGTTGAGAEFAVGYDGEAFIDGLDASNSVSIGYLGQTCSATFDFAPESGQQVKIGPVACL